MADTTEEKVDFYNETVSTVGDVFSITLAAKTERKLIRS